MMEAAGKCVEYRKMGYHCSESSLRAVSDTLKIEIPPVLLKVSSGFRGGGGGYRERCGIVEAGIMLISYLYGRTRPDESVSEYSYLIRILHERFLEEMGSYTCRVLVPVCSAPDMSIFFIRSFIYARGAAVVTRLLLEADDLIRQMPEEEKDR